MYVYIYLRAFNVDPVNQINGSNKRYVNAKTNDFFAN